MPAGLPQTFLQANAPAVNDHEVNVHQDPNDYFIPNADGALGGNPAFSPFLSGPVIPPNPNEAGRKGVAKVFPGFVNRFAIRWAPQATPIDGVHAGKNLFSFDPTRGPGYLLHCHILDHEDNEMMRPYLPVP